MKKLILLLALALGVEVKGQIVGGFIPINSSKTPTMGGLRVNGTSTFTGNALFSSSVGIGSLPNSSSVSLRVTNGTNTVDIGKVSGSASIWLQQTTPSASNYAILGTANVTEVHATNSVNINAGAGANINVTTSGVRIGSNVGATAVLDVTGDAKVSSTFSLGSANLTGGNTGTVAVLSDAVFALNLGGGLMNGNGNPGDGVTYYYTNMSNVYSQQGAGKIYIPYNCTLVGWSFTGYITSVASSAESSTLQINIDNSATNLNTAITFSVGGGVNTYSASGLSINVNANSYIEGKIVNPTWVTNPQGLVSGVTFWFVRRS